MPIPRFEVPVGVINGVNTVFAVSQPYMPGSTAVFLNGLLQEKTLTDGWIETDPSAGIITLKEPPRSTGTSADVLQVFYLDTSPALLETETTTMTGKISSVDVVSGYLIDVSRLSGVLRC